jgi:hypothetical protein
VAGSAFGARLGLPLWAMALPGVAIAMACALFGSAFFCMVAVLGTLVVGTGVVLGSLAARSKGAWDAHLAFGIFVGYAFGLWLPVF